MFWGKQISVIPSESYMQMKIKCKSIILMSLWDVLMSNFFCINSGAKMLSLFQSTPQSLPMLSSCRSHFLLWKTSLFLHFSLGLVQNKSHWKNVQTWGEKRSPTYFKALETNCGKWHKSPASQEQLVGGLGRESGEAPLLFPEDKAVCSSAACWLPALSLCWVPYRHWHHWTKRK